MKKLPFIHFFHNAGTHGMLINGRFYLWLLTIHLPTKLIMFSRNPKESGKQLKAYGLKLNPLRFTDYTKASLDELYR